MKDVPVICPAIAHCKCSSFDMSDQDVSNIEEYVIDVPKISFEKTQFHCWYGKEVFARKTMRSLVLDLPASFILYLGEDGVIIPKSLCNSPDSEDGESSDGDEGVNDNAINLEAAREEDFRRLNREVTEAIGELGGEVFPKLNWSCPLDASWMNAGSLKCFNSQEVYILLKSSDRITYDLEHTMLQAGEKTNKKLVLRKWANLNPSMEFRFYVRKGMLVGLCQRDSSTFYDFLAKEDERERIENILLDFYYTGSDFNHYTTAPSTSSAPDGTDTTDAIDTAGSGGEAWVANALGLQDFVLDVYIDKRDRVWIIDFNVYGRPTDPLLYTYRELDSLTDHLLGVSGSGSGSGVFALEADVSLKVVSSELERIVRRRADISCSTGPIDVTEAPDFHANWEEVLKRQKEEDEEDKEDKEEESRA